MADPYVQPGYWVYGYAEGDERIENVYVPASSFKLKQYKDASFFPAIGFSESAISYSVTTALPSGLVLNRVTGEITGSPNYLQGPAVYTIILKDADYAGFSAEFTIEVVKDASNGIEAQDIRAMGASRVAIQYRSQL